MPKLMMKGKHPITRISKRLGRIKAWIGRPWSISVDKPMDSPAGFNSI
jgi:hypothetical protein